MELKIACRGATTVNIDDIIELQGNLKTLSESEEIKLRRSMEDYGFSFPIDIWKDEKTGNTYIIDAHQRKKILLKMREMGWSIPPLPADYIFAKDKKEAREKLLLAASRYGSVDEVGLNEYLNQPGFEIGSAEIADYIEFPEIDFGEPPIEEEKIKAKQKREEEIIKCPQCNTEFTLSESKLAQ